MDVKDFKHIVIKKNRGWRGLAKATVFNAEGKELTSMIFSFSQQVWEDLLHGYIVIQDIDNYYVITFDNTESLPSPTQQRSVLIKYFTANITAVTKFPKKSWASSTGTDYSLICHFIKNKNNHTTSDWNYIGIRVIPEI